MGSLTAAWMAITGIITYRSFANYQRPPLPSELGAAALLYGVLSLAPEEAGGAVGALGWALVVAAFLNLFPTGPRPCAGSVSPVLPGVGTVPSTTGAPTR